MSELDDKAEVLVEGVVAGAIGQELHQRAMSAAVARVALRTYAILTSHQSAADQAFAIFRFHTDRAAKAPKRMGSQR
jgi:hypothetical protein